jgi:hypothetical protein
MSTWREHDPRFHKLLAFLSRIPAVETNDTSSRGFGSGIDGGMWWVKFSLSIDHPLSWSVVQEMAHVLNYVSVTEPLPTIFKPVSPPPYLSGGPRDFLSWVIEGPVDSFGPDAAAEWLEGRMPKPVEDVSAWPVDE